MDADKSVTATFVRTSVLTLPEGASGDFVAVSGDRVVVAGSFGNGVLIGGQMPVATRGPRDAFIAAFDLEGKPIHVKTFGVVGGEAVRGLAAKTSNDVVLSGEFSGTEPLSLWGRTVPGGAGIIPFSFVLDKDGGVLSSIAAGCPNVAIDSRGNFLTCEPRLPARLSKRASPPSWSGNLLPTCLSVSPLSARGSTTLPCCAAPVRSR